MSVFGPRLDRPSGVGDEGRARAASLTIAALVLVALAVAAGAVSGDPRQFGGYATLAALVAAGAALLNRDGIGATVVGHLLFLPGSVALLALAVLSFGAGPQGILAAGFAVAVLGLAGAWTDVADDESLRAVAAQSALSYVLTLVVAVVASVAIALVGAVWLVVDSLAGGASAGAALAGFLFVLSLTLACVRLATGTLPIVQLAATDRRDAARARLSRANTVCSVGSVVAFGLSLVMGALAAVGAMGAVTVAPLTLLGSVVVLGPLLAVAAAALLAAMGAYALRALTRQYGGASARHVAAGVAACFFTALLYGAFLPIVSLAGLVGPVALAGGAVLGPIAVLLVLGLALLCMRLGLVPERAAGPATAAAGLVIAAIGAGLGGLPSPLVFACVAGALLVWDVGSFGLGVTAELGHVPETRRIELVHGVFGVAVGAVAVLALTALDWLRAEVAMEAAAAPAAVIVLGVVLLLALLRG